MKPFVTKKFECEMITEDEDGNTVKRRLSYDGSWKGTPGTDGKETAKAVVKFLKNNM